MYIRGFSACHTTPHAHTHTPRPQRHTHKTQQPPPQQHTETGRDRERRQRKKTKKERQRKEETRQEKRREKRQNEEEEREDERENGERCYEMREETFILRKMFENRQIRQKNQPKMFRKKSLSDELFLHFCSKVQNLTVFSINNMIRIRFSGPGELIQKHFRAAQYSQLFQPFVFRKNLPSMTWKGNKW